MLGNRLKAEVIGGNGHVDYEGLQKSETFAELERTSSLLHHIDPEQLIEDDARIAFWINVYNVLAIHGVVATGVHESVMEIPSFFGVVGFIIGPILAALFVTIWEMYGVAFKDVLPLVAPSQNKEHDE